MQQKYINYVGPSMNPLLKDGDGLHIIPYKDRVIRKGDVVVFVPPGSDMKVVHRVVSCSDAGIRTRGDNGRYVDPWLLTTDDILGRVTYIQRRNRRRTIHGGVLGRVAAYSFRCRRVCNAIVSLLLHPAYRLLCRSTVLRNRLHRLLKPKVLSFRRPEGAELQIVVGRRLIGRLRPGRVEWEIRRPFRLCVDERLLPGKGSAAETKRKEESSGLCAQRACSTRD
jgi:hypothetical protein